MFIQKDNCVFNDSNFILAFFNILPLKTKVFEFGNLKSLIIFELTYFNVIGIEQSVKKFGLE